MLFYDIEFQKSIQNSNNTHTIIKSTFVSSSGGENCSCLKIALNEQKYFGL